MKQKGQGLVEYAIILLIAVAALYGLYLLIVRTQSTFLMVIAAVVIGGGIGWRIAILFDAFNLIYRYNLDEDIRKGYFIIGGSIVTAILIGYFVFTFLNNQSMNIIGSRTADTLLLAGKIVDTKTGDWNNNRLIVVYERNTEVGRGVSLRGEFPESNQGVIDGLFRVEFPNTYQLSLGNLNAGDPGIQFSYAKHPDGWFGKKEYLYHWFGDFNEGNSQRVSIPSKNLTYMVVVFPGDVSSLPPEIINGLTEIRDGKIVAIPKESPLPALEISGDYQLQDVVYNVSTENREANKFTVPIDNCKSDQELRNPYSYTQTFVHKYTEETTAKAGVEAKLPELSWLNIIAELQKKYGFEDSQINTTTINYEMNAAPHTFQLYTVTWIEVWEHGIATVIQDDQSLSVPFEVKTNLIYSIASETQACP